MYKAAGVPVWGVGVQGHMHHVDPMVVEVHVWVSIYKVKFILSRSLY